MVKKSLGSWKADYLKAVTCWVNVHVSGWVESIHGQQKRCCVFGQALSPCHGQQVRIKARATADDSCHTDALLPSL